MANPGPASVQTQNSQAPFSNFQQVAVLSVPLTPVSVATVTIAEQSFTVTGLQVGDVIVWTKPALANAVAPVNMRVSAANTLTVAYVNPTAGALTPTAETYLITVFRQVANLPAISAMPIL